MPTPVAPSVAAIASEPTSLDEFLNGRLILHQPKKGFRAGLDSVLLGAAVSPSAKTLLDLGSGIGAAGLIAQTHNAGLTAHFLDNNQQAIALCRTNIDINNVAKRAKIFHLDIAAKGSARQQVGLRDDFYDCVIANPPYYKAGSISQLDDDYKSAAFTSPAGALETWVKTATSCARQGGAVIFIHRAEALAELLTACQPRLGDIDILPLTPFPGAPASRVLIRGKRGARGPLTLHPPRPLHCDKGGPFTTEIDKIMRGQMILHWN